MVSKWTGPPRRPPHPLLSPAGKRGLRGAAGSFGPTLLPVAPQRQAAIGLARNDPGEERNAGRNGPNAAIPEADRHDARMGRVQNDRVTLPGRGLDLEGKVAVVKSRKTVGERPTETVTRYVVGTAPTLGRVRAPG